MKIGDRVFVRGYIDEIRKDTVIVRNDGGYFGTIPSEVITGDLPSAQPDLEEAYICGETEAEARYHAEIVRCKNCKHQVKEWRTDKRLKDNGYMVCGCDVVGDACGYWALLGQDDDYCSYAERRTDDR